MVDGEIWLESCKECDGKGVVKAGGLGLWGICPKCEGACFVPHDCMRGEDAGEAE